MDATSTQVLDADPRVSINAALKMIIQKQYKLLMRQRAEHGIPGILCFELEDLTRSDSVVPTFWTTDAIEERRRTGAQGWDEIAPRLVTPKIKGEVLFATTVKGDLITYVSILPMAALG